jgi:hypothetical protein
LLDDEDEGTARKARCRDGRRAGYAEAWDELKIDGDLDSLRIEATMEKESAA